MKEENPDRVFYRQLYEEINSAILQLSSSKSYKYSSEATRRLARMKFLDLQRMLIEFAKSKSWLDSKLDLEEIEKRCRNGRCKDCE